MPALARARAEESCCFASDADAHSHYISLLTVFTAALAAASSSLFPPSPPKWEECALVHVFRRRRRRRLLLSPSSFPGAFKLFSLQLVSAAPERDRADCHSDARSSFSSDCCFTPPLLFLLSRNCIFRTSGERRERKSSKPRIRRLGFHPFSPSPRIKNSFRKRGQKSGKWNKNNKYAPGEKVSV